MVGVLTRPAFSFTVMSDYKNLQVWQKAHALALHAHRTAIAEGVEVRKMLHGLLKKIGLPTQPPPDASKSKTPV
jgi:hypothetical protein